jgi:hypothetical protein
MRAIKELSIAVSAGAIVGIFVPRSFPMARDNAWLWSTAGGAVACGLFVIGGRILGAHGNCPLGWVLGGPFGMTIGGAFWLDWIVDPRYPYSFWLLGGWAGALCGALGGATLGVITLLQERRRRQSDGPPVAVSAAMVSAIFALELAALYGIRPMQLLG